MGVTWYVKPPLSRGGSKRKLGSHPQTDAEVHECAPPPAPREEPARPTDGRHLSFPQPQLTNQPPR